MRPHIQRIAGLCCALGIAGIIPLQAKLEWTQLAQRPELKLGEREVQVAFEYRNTGTEPVTITEVRTSCGCTAAKLEDPVVMPGQTGHIDVLFRVGERTGAQRIMTHVTTDDPENSVTSLTLAVDIPQLVSASPRILFWRSHEPNSWKKISFRVHPDIDVASVSAYDTGNHFTVELDDSANDGSYVLRAKPQAFKSRTQGSLELNITDTSGEEYRTNFRALMQ